MSFTIDFATEFSCFRVDPELDEYSSNASDLILPMRYNKALKPEVENKDEEDIENPGSCFPLSKGDIQHLPSIFDKHNSWF